MHAKDNSGAEPSGEVVYLEPVRPNQEDTWRAPNQKQLYKHKGRGRSPEISIKRERNAVPKGEPFIWMTLEMLESPAWRALPPAAKQVIDRVGVEHLQHAGKENGKLPVTYNDFENYGLRRMSIRFGVLAAQALGFITVTEEGHAGAGDTRRAARYALTWVDRHDGAPRSNEWKRFETLADANKLVTGIRANLKAETRERSRRKDKLKAAA
jgi:hypothetical protein